jgi:hypothetical protein
MLGVINGGRRRCEVEDRVNGVVPMERLRDVVAEEVERRISFEVGEVGR